MSRAETRHYAARNLAKWRRIASRWVPDSEDVAERMAHRLAGHGKRCSCYMCGNPRRHFGKRTMQEVRADLERI